MPDPIDSNVRSSRQSALRSSRGAAKRGDSPATFEPMEARQLLVADLGIGFRTFSGVPMTLVPGDRLTIPTVTSNQGDQPIDGRVSIRYLLSKDNIVDANDIQIGNFENLRLALSVGASANRNDVVTIPNVVPDSYFFLVQLTPDSAIGDLNQANDVKFNTTAQPFKWSFGNFDGRTDVTLTLTGTEGVQAIFALSSGGRGTVVRNSVNTDRFDVTIENSVATSNAVISASGGSGANANVALINNVTVTGSLESLDGFKARLHGNVNISGTAGFVRFVEVRGPSAIDIRGTGVNTDFELGKVTNLVLTTASGIDSLLVSSWTDSDTALDRVQARWIARLTSTGNFQAGLQLSGRPGGARTLDAVTIGGTASKGAWRVVGRGGDWSFRGVAASWSGSVRNNLPSLTVRTNFHGVIAARAITTIMIGGLRSAHILAGAYLGNDARLGGTGADADSYGGGTIGTLKVFGTVVNSIVGAGLDPVDGVFKNGNDVLRSGQINSVVVNRTASASSRFLARRYPGAGPFRINNAAVNTSTDMRFKRDEFTPPLLTDVTLDSSSLPARISITIRDTQGVNVSTLGNNNLLLMRPDGTTTLLSHIFPSPAPVNGPVITGEWTIGAPGGTWDAADNGTYQIMVVGGTIKDTLGNAVAAGTIATFTIAL